MGLENDVGIPSLVACAATWPIMSAISWPMSRIHRASPVPIPGTH